MDCQKVMSWHVFTAIDPRGYNLTTNIRNFVTIPEYSSVKGNGSERPGTLLSITGTIIAGMRYWHNYCHYQGITSKDVPVPVWYRSCDNECWLLIGWDPVMGWNTEPWLVGSGSWLRWHLTALEEVFLLFCSQHSIIVFHKSVVISIWRSSQGYTSVWRVAVKYFYRSVTKYFFIGYKTRNLAGDKKPMFPSLSVWEDSGKLSFLASCKIL